MHYLFVLKEHFKRDLVGLVLHFEILEVANQIRKEKAKYQ